MSLKRTTFKQRIRKNDLKQRNAVSSGIRKRMRAGRRVSNKFDQIDNGSRPMEAMMMEIQDGCAVPTQESSLDPRALTDLLLSSAADVEPVVKPAKPTASTTDKETPATMILPLAAAMNTVSARLEMLNAAAEEDAERRRAVLASQTQTTNKNQYRHHGQPYLFWQRIGVHPLLLLALRDMKFSHPTPVQEEVLPNVISVKDGSSTEAKSKKRKASKTGTDVIVSAETGSGKTLVFALPILNRVLADCFPSAGAKDGASASSSSSSLTPATTKKTKGEKRSRASEEDANQENKDLPAQDEDYMRRLMHSLIISPTRELALQINDAMTQLTKHAPQIRIGCVVGGMAQEKQQRILNRHPHILICTPGRLWELVQKNEGCYLGHSMSRRLRYIVLDEADKMLQSGRFEELKNLLERIHCETLPAGFAQDREEGAEIEEVKVQEGRWDAVKQCFVPFSKEEGAPKKKEPTPVKKSSSKKASRETEVKKSKGKKRRQEEEEEEEEEEGDEEDELKATSAGPRSKKDQPRTIPMPPEPAADHRVVTFVTSATLSLQTNYERRDYKSNKSIIRTSNADVMNKVLQQLEIKPTNAQIFTLSPTADVAAKINETYLRCPDDSKDLYLYYFLKTYSQDRAVIFVNAISMLRRLVKLLEILGLPVVGLHASMQQRQRLKYIEKFKRGELRVLVATDVASRGLDIEGLKYVVHYQVPRTTDAYIHRCGRTARCGGTGLSLLLVNATEYVSFNKLMESLGRKEREMETFALQPSVVHQLHQPLRMALQIDKLQKEVDKSRAKNTWVSRMSRDAELDVDDMFDDEADGENRSKLKAIRALKKELDHLSKKFTGSFGGKGAFRTGASALGAKEAERKFQERADRQTIKVAKLTKARR